MLGRLYSLPLRFSVTIRKIERGLGRHIYLRRRSFSMFFRHSRSQDRTSCGRKCASEWQDNARGFPNWTNISSACVTSSTRTKYIGERLPLEASHCVLEYILRLSAITHVQDIVDNHRLVSFASLEIRGVARCFSTCKRIEWESRRARPSSWLETLR